VGRSGWLRSVRLDHDRANESTSARLDVTLRCGKMQCWERYATQRRWPRRSGAIGKITWCKALCRFQYW